MEYIQIIVPCITFCGVLAAMYLNWKMIKFTSEYGKRWKTAWTVFFIALCLILVRRGIGILWGILGLCLHPIFEDIDYLVIATLCTILYVIFIYLNYTWWKLFFDKYKIEETVITHVIAEDANHVEIDEPKVVKVDIDGKNVSIEQVRRVLVQKPKKVEVKKDGVLTTGKEKE